LEARASERLSARTHEPPARPLGGKCRRKPSSAAKWRRPTSLNGSPLATAIARPMNFQIARWSESENLLGNSLVSRTEPLRTVKSPVAQLASEFRGPRNRPVSSLPSGSSWENHLSNEPPKGRQVTGVRGSRHFDPCDSAKRRVRPPESHRHPRFWRLFCKPARLYGGEKPVTFRCFISGTGDFPMLSCAEPVTFRCSPAPNR